MDILGRDGHKRLHNGFLQGLMGPGFDSSQERFEFGKGLLNGGEIGRVGR